MFEVIGLSVRSKTIKYSEKRLLAAEVSLAGDILRMPAQALAGAAHATRHGEVF
jgi:hypothetical protein